MNYLDPITQEHGMPVGSRIDVPSIPLTIGVLARVLIAMKNDGSAERGEALQINAALRALADHGGDGAPSAPVRRSKKDQTFAGPADRCVVCDEIAGPIGLRKHPIYAVKVKVVKGDKEFGTVYPDLADFYAHTLDDAMILKGQFGGRPVSVEKWNGKEWEEVQ
jgi:hypothetical protein